MTWYALRAFNSQTVYGWTRDEDVVFACLAELNRGREVNLYHAEDLGEEADATDGDGSLCLHERDDLTFNDDTKPEDFEAKP